MTSHGCSLFEAGHGDELQMIMVSTEHHYGTSCVNHC
uniref:Uncharacterized protein n=1 Tax=Arundo donax TaxID=35708 RepID=A0A0A8YT27_ARUDO